jgi:HAE1 family hydrophobic/amphiphilic exporter-1
VFDAPGCALYDWTLRADLRFRAVTMAVVGAARRHGLPVHARAEGLPAERGSGRFNGSTEAIQGIGFDEMVAHQLEVADIVAKDPNVAAFSNNVGGRRRRRRRATPGDLVDLKPRDERTRRSIRSSPSCGRSWRRCPASACSWSNPAADQRSAASRGARSLSVHAAGHRHRRAVPRAPMLEAEAARDCPARGRQQRPADQEPAGPSTWIATRFGALGLTVNQVETALYNAYGTRQVSQIYAPNNQYQVIMQVAPEFQQDPAALSMLYVRSTRRPADSARTRSRRSSTDDVGPLSVNHTGSCRR